MKTIIYNCQTIFPNKISNASVILSNGMIMGIEETNQDISNFDIAIDAHKNYLVPGFIDLHCHGCNGFDFMDNTILAIDNICKYMIQNGVLSFYPTTLSSDIEDLIAFLSLIDSIDNARSIYASIEGVHLEGPYLSECAAGAQDKKSIHLPLDNEVEKILNTTYKIQRWSLAPEILGIENITRLCNERGILLSVAHTDAGFYEIKKSRELGFSHITHLYSGMKTIYYENGMRKSGAVEAALYFDDLTVELIGDGIHVPYELLELVYKIKGADKIAIVSDSMRATGLKGVTEGYLGNLLKGQKVFIEDGVAKSRISGTLAGSVTPLIDMVKNIYYKTSIPLIDIIKMVTKSPASISGLKNKGEICPGYEANLLLLNSQLDIEMIIFQGKIIQREK